MGQINRPEAAKETTLKTRLVSNSDCTMNDISVDI